MAANPPELAELVTASAIEVTAPVAGPDPGLSAAQAAQRLVEDGPNALPLSLIHI